MSPTHCILTLGLLLSLGTHRVPAQQQPSAEDLARMVQDPLANIAAVSSDNAIDFGRGPDERTGANLQIQPVYSFDAGAVTLIPRGIIPILAVPGRSPLEDPQTTWGLSDITAQVFVAPKGGGDWKWGLGPQFSLKTRTNDNVAGPGWGAGPAGVLIGSVGPWTLGSLVGQLWSYDGNTSSMLVQPLIFYNVSSVPGLALAYNPPITINWKAPKRDNKLTLPLGMGVGKTFNLGCGYAVDLSAGAYAMAVRPENAPKWQLRFAAFFVFPRG